MDILHPAAPALPHTEKSHAQVAIDEAEKTLHDFKYFCKNKTEEATTLYKAAKDLVKEVHSNVVQGKEKVASGEWTEEDLEQSHTNLQKKQEKPWEVLKDKADKLRVEIDGQNKLVMSAKDDVVRARGDSVTGGWFGFASKEQKEVRKVYDHRMKYGFEEAAENYKALTSYPDGLLTQIHLLQKRAQSDLSHAKVHQNLFLASHTSA